MASAASNGKRRHQHRKAGYRRNTKINIVAAESEKNEIEKGVAVIIVKMAAKKLANRRRNGETAVAHQPAKSQRNENGIEISIGEEISAKMKREMKKMKMKMANRKRQ
jgi:hypothetical protein